MSSRKKTVTFLILGALLSLGIFVAWPKAGLYILAFFFSEWTPGLIRFTVKSTADDRPIITFQQSSIQYGRHPFLVTYVFEVLPSRPGLWRPVWSMKEKSGAWSHRLEMLTYGECPPQFNQTVAPELLLEGHFYRVCSSEIIRKVGRCKYEVIPYDEYLQAVKEGQFQDPRDLVKEGWAIMETE